MIAAREPLSTRRLAAEVGTSTSAVYTHFGSMTDVRRAIRRVGFERLAEYQASYDRTDDPVADVVKQGWAYCRNAFDNPNMYRVMFMEAPIDETDAEVGRYTFQILVDEVRRCVDAKRFRGDPENMASQLWAGTHGVVALHLAGMFDEDQANHLTAVMARALCISFGDRPDDTDESFGRAALWIAEDQRAGSGATRPE